MTDFSTREKQDVVRALKAIRKLLQRKGLPVVKGRPHIKKSTVITHARVPVIKLTAVVPGHRQPVNMDISIGANNGLAAIQTAKNMGAVVLGYDVRPVVKEQVESMGGQFLKVPYEEDGAGQGGYAKEMSDEYKAAEQVREAASS